MKTEKNDHEYDPTDDLKNSILVCYEAIRERMKLGGAPYIPQEPGSRNGPSLNLAKKEAFNELL